MIHISASDLVKKSAKQICYFRDKNVKSKITEGMIKGNEAALNKSTSKYVEMRGALVCGANNNLHIHYTFDEINIVAPNNIQLIEHKNLTEGRIVEDWYLQYSVIQLALYASFASVNPNKNYVTATFHVNQGYAKQELELPFDTRKCTYSPVLVFGNTKYNVLPQDDIAISDFYISKAKASLNYESAAAWDYRWKFKEWEDLKEFIVFHKIL